MPLFPQDSFYGTKTKSSQGYNAKQRGGAKRKLVISQYKGDKLAENEIEGRVFVSGRNFHNIDE